ncbi:nicotinic acid mononucleotide adenylyltransferase [Anaerosolibacter carboniphilus]|uniref:nicotinate-nucleotide adenylyltransferase n=1 Tax=Anaerosolibacter carboniphilus TaxID=1417629 RepID=A0A841L943_9FIRM|nr:cytidyltransferase [Anaerosolibacter carboniphilus]MBB6218899.1 nicotinic acid mononucleotide adenylyltransferase [Anaerosolibacter carboniphilus]
MFYPASTKLYDQIVNVLLHPNFLQEFSLQHKQVRKYIKDSSFIEQIQRMVAMEIYTCQMVLKLCEDMMLEVTEGDAPEDWLEYIFQYTLSKCFPGAVEIELKEHLEKASTLYLQVLRVVSNFQKTSRDGTWQSLYPLELLTEEEEEALENPEEYRAFKKAFDHDYIYEMMKLNYEVKGFSTLDHICGVHYLALHVGRQLKAAGVPIDLGRVSGAAAGHDIGKYGCRGVEVKRVPYLHYYYTGEWFKGHDIVYIRNVAINHSTWDLELENLSLESLILIYCDFRVKKKDGKTEGTGMHIFSLKDSFEVVLEKLDNVDAAKEQRYRRVYAKLEDFEKYMLQLGVNIEVGEVHQEPENRKKLQKNYALMEGEEVVEHLKHLAIHHNIRLMYMLRDESSLNSILEIARSEVELNRLRGYLNVIEEYSTYLTQKQKLITIQFLYELLTHPEDDIRKQCGELIGVLIALFDEEYRKEVPKDVQLKPAEMPGYGIFDKYLQLILYPDRKMTSIHRKWIGYNLSNVVTSIFSQCRKGQIREYIKTLLNYYRDEQPGDENTKIYQLEAIKHIPIYYCENEDIEILLDFIELGLQREEDTLRISALEAMGYLFSRLHQDGTCVERLKAMLVGVIHDSALIVENYMKLKLARMFKLGEFYIEKLEKRYKEDLGRTSDLFLSNLKTATHWTIKKAQVEFILDYTLDYQRNTGLHTAMHYCNLIKVSASQSVRKRAGEALIGIAPYLSLEQKNDIAIEMLRALEIEGYQFTKHIPDYLGRLILYLQPVELDEIIDDLMDKVKISNTQINSLLLQTIGIAIEHYPKYREFFQEEDGAYTNRLIRMLGILLNGMANYKEQTKQVAFRVIGKGIFGSAQLELEEKYHIFQLMAKKILTLLSDNMEDKELAFLNNSAGLNHIYRFISDCKFYRGEVQVQAQGRVAFFPGTFDPFTLSHKEIAKAIRDLGYEVYLAVDEFSWSKRTQANLIRRNIIKMSVANELGIYLYPEDLPTNIANPKDLEGLRANFPDADVHVVVGSDVVLNASAYREVQRNHSIHTFPHILFERVTGIGLERGQEMVEALNRISAGVIRLSLPQQYEDISSTQIRNYIDENRDTSNLMDPLVQKYIYAKGLYRREPQYKTLMEIKSVSVEIVEVEDFTPELFKDLSEQFCQNPRESLEQFHELSEKLSPKILLLRSTDRHGKILGFSAFHWVRSSMLYKEFKNEEISRYIRRNAIGRILVIDGIFAGDQEKFDNLDQVLLTETLAYNLAKDYTYAVFKNTVDKYVSPNLYDTLVLQGFISLEDENHKILAVDMTTPCTLGLEMESVIKEPFRSSEEVKKAMGRSRKRLQEAIVKLYPGNLVLAFDRAMMNENLIKKVCEINGVPTTPLVPRTLGPMMCVAFGMMLHGSIIPNTVTKSLHTDRQFGTDMKDYRTGAYPYYLNLENQVRMLRSFDRPVIIVDDILVQGHRLKALDPLLKNENVQVEKVLVGVLSDRGKELMDMQNREVDYAYYIPKLRVWFNESLLYPFISGDTLWRGYYPERNLIPSVNFILPYTYPGFIKGTSKEAIYHLSEVCLENAMDIMATVEAEYQRVHERKFTLAHLGEVFVSPRYPDHGKDVYYDINLNPSHYLKNDIEHLQRLKRMCLE